MGNEPVVSIRDLVYGVADGRTVLSGLSADWAAGSFTTILGQNGAGKTTLFDLLLGFRTPKSGTVQVLGHVPHEDPWRMRQEVAYLSEKVDVPGDWGVGEFLEFNRYFYTHYSRERETEIARIFRVEPKRRLGTMSAGEIRRVQIVAALAQKPKLILIDEVTAVLDIVGRRQLMEILADSNRRFGTTVIMATNILEDLESYVTHVAILDGGRFHSVDQLAQFMKRKPGESFSRIVSTLLEDAA